MVGEPGEALVDNVMQINRRASIINPRVATKKDALL